jgi:hypothetical protein
MIAVENAGDAGLRDPRPRHLHPDLADRFLFDARHYALRVRWIFSLVTPRSRRSRQDGYVASVTVL